MSFFKKLIFDEISISHLQFALYLSLVVQFSMTVATAFSRQPCYYTTLLTLCQYLFKTFFKIFLGVLTEPQALYFCRPVGQLSYFTTLLPFCQVLFCIFFETVHFNKNPPLNQQGADIFHKYRPKFAKIRLYPLNIFPVFRIDFL